jgi:hypothetical protein
MLLNRSGSEEAKGGCSQGGKEVLFHWYEFSRFRGFLVFRFGILISFCFLKKPEGLTVNPTLNLIPVFGFCKLVPGSFT